MNLTCSRPAALALALMALALPARAGDADFAVLKVARGDDTAFQAVAARDAGAEKARIAKEAKEALAAWEKAKEAFLKDKANKGLEFLDPKPALATVTVAKDGFASEADAKQFAEEQQKKADGKYAVIRVKDCEGTVTLDVILQKRIKARDLELKADYQKKKSEWQSRANAHYAAEAGKNPPQPFTLTKPSEPKLERLKDGIPTEEEAKRLYTEFKAAEKPEKERR